MTESEWDGCADPVLMLEFLRAKASDRKHRLFAVACCRALWDLVPHQRNREMVEAAERYADGLADSAELRQAVERAWNWYAVGVAAPEGHAAAVGALRGGPGTSSRSAAFPSA